MKQTLASTGAFRLIAGLLLFAGQHFSILHAAEHPFHVPGDNCELFISVEQHDLAVSCLAQTTERHQSLDEFNSQGQTQVLLSFIHTNHARAPPLPS